MFLRRLAKILGRLAAGLLVLGIVATLALNFALDRVPRYQTEIKAWVHQQTGLHVRFAHVAATLRWYGPELSFRQLELRSRDDRRVLAKTARGRIGWDLWRLLASGRLFAGRIELDSPDIVVARIGPTRFAPASEQSLQSGGKAVAGFRFADLPPGILVIRHGRVSVTGWNRQLPRLTLHDVNLQVRRDADAIHLRFDAVLPAVLGGKLNLRGRLGNVGASPAALDWSADLRTRNVSFRGWRRLLPAYLDHLKSGSGAFELKANGIGHDLGDANFDFEATNVAARSNDGSTAKFERIGGHLELAHQGDRWTLLGRHVQALRSGRVDPPSQFEVTWRAKRGGGFHLRARASYLRADNLLPLAALLPRKSSRERLIAISPTGEWRNASLRLERLRAGDHWHFTVHAQFRDAGFGAFGRTPGLRGLSGSVAGDQRAGHVTFSTHAATLAWPAQWPRPVRLDALGGTVFWSRTPAGLLMATPRTVMANDDGRVSLLASMLLPANGRSPIVNLYARLINGNIADTGRYLPHAKLHPKSLAWLERAFIAGSVPSAAVSLHGPIRHFPFRDGSGVFDASLNIQGLTLDYGPGWPMIEQAAASAEFRDQGLKVHVLGAQLGGLRVTGADAGFADFKDAILRLHASIKGRTSVALRFLRDSPINRLAHGGFSPVRGQGAVRAEVDLRFPFKDFVHRRVVVRGFLRGVALRRSGLPVTASDLAGEFTVDGSAVVQADLNGRLLGGPVHVTALAPDGKRTIRTRLRFRGVASGAAVAAAIGPSAEGLTSGKARWQALLTLVPAGLHQRVLHVTSNFEGLALHLPEPFAKRADQPLPSRLDARWTQTTAPTLHFVLGSVLRGILQLRFVNGALRLAHAAIGFGGAAPRISGVQTVDLRGRIARLDLAGWRRWLPHGDGAKLSSYLHRAHLAIGEMDFDGLSARGLDLRLRADGDRWRLAADGPSAQGTLSWPAAAVRAGSWNFDFSRLAIVAASPDPAVGGEHGAQRAPPLGPAGLPAVRLQVKRLLWLGRRLGDVRAKVSTLPNGVTLDDLRITGRSFSAEMHGDWLGPARGTGHLVGTLSSRDVEDTMSDLGYERLIAAKKGRLDFDLHWSGAPTVAAFRAASGQVTVSLENGQVFGIKPGAGRVLGLASIAALPRRLALDFSDLTDKGLAFDTVAGTFKLHGGNAYTRDVLLKGPAARIGLFGRIGLENRDYDQTAVVTGSIGNSLPLAGALAGGPVVGAALLLFTQVFKQPLRGLARGYYHISGGWNDPTVKRINGSAAAAAIAEEKQ